MSSNADAAGAGPVTLAVADVTASDDDGNKPQNTVDGDVGTRWSAKGDGQWIRWDLGAVHSLADVGIAFYKGDGRVNTFDLEISVDGGTPVRVLRGLRSSGHGTGLETFTLPAVDGRFVRYIGHGNDDNAWNSLTEVKVHGVATASSQGDEQPPAVQPAVTTPSAVTAPSASATAQVVPHPRPPSLKASPIYRVFVGSPEQEVFTEQFTKNRTIHLAYLSAAGGVPIRVQVAKPFKPKVQISPKSRKIDHSVDGDSIRFTIAKPEKLILFFPTDSGELDPLYLLVDPVETDAPAPADVQHFFGPGVHDVGDLQLGSDETAYLAAGALVIGRVSAKRASNVTIRGRGILQETPEGEGYTIRMDGCTTVRVEGITIRDVQEGWSTRFVGCDGVLVRDVKVFSCGVREDGIDPDASRNFTIDGCLISTGDDCIAIKSVNGGEVSGITVTRTVLDSYPGGGGGDGVKIGTELTGPKVHDILVKDCDVVRAYGENDVGGHSAFSIVHKGGAQVFNVRYEDIRVEDRIGHKNFEIILKPGGSVSAVTLENITWEGRHPINVIGKNIDNVNFHGCTMAGKPVGPGDVNQQKGPAGLTFT